MPEYVLNRNHTFRSLHGHIINFVKGEPVYVPPILERDVTQFGAEPVSGERIDLLDDLPAAAQAPVGEARRAAILAAYEAMEQRNTRGDFTGQGRPNTKALGAIVGFEVDNRERDDLWEEYRQSKA